MENHARYFKDAFTGYLVHHRHQQDMRLARMARHIESYRIMMPSFGRRNLGIYDLVFCFSIENIVDHQRGLNVGIIPICVLVPISCQFLLGCVSPGRRSSSITDRERWSSQNPIFGVIAEQGVPPLLPGIQGWDTAG